MSYIDEIYTSARAQIKNFRRANYTWDEIRYALKSNEEGLQSYLLNKINEEYWDSSIDVKTWYELVESHKRAEETSINFEVIGSSIVTNGEKDGNYISPTSKSSAWMSYKDKLLNVSHFKEDAVREIENTTIRILNRLKKSTPKDVPNKGLVIGNVQSGKTANMAALMAMAADYGWNMFIILSGTIENLRKQTQDRLISDLGHGNKGLVWRPLENVKVGAYPELRNLMLQESSRDRYFMVTLKNVSRLKDLLKWLGRDQGKRQQIKLLIIDDEADQAGVNTADIDQEKRTKINELIMALVYNKNHDIKDVSKGFSCVNYVGYTATPYANVLNESPNNPGNLFPEDFVAVLKPSNEYFGPLQFFGYDELEPLNIVNNIPVEELKMISKIHKGEERNLLNAIEFIKAVSWFYCSLACFRFWNLRKPVSMLVHTSQKTDAHFEMAEALKNVIKSIDQIDFIKICEEVWQEQTSKFTKEDFYKQYPNFGSQNISSYPSFESIKEIIIMIFLKDVQYIQMDDEGDLQYSDGIHLCVDNCKANKMEEDYHVRLAYPKKEDKIEFATGFIVIGGATLSRGLTIEGLVSSYFLRTVKQGDTLMQMGRWFGYRKDYELLPRIWLTTQTQDKFVYLTKLDYLLRETMQFMDVTNKKPREFGIKVKNTPKPSFLMVTAKNKMQQAELIDFDFTGAVNQTVSFSSDENAMIENIKATQQFMKDVDSIAAVDKNEKDTTYIWHDIPHDMVFDYLEKLNIPNNATSFLEIELIREWFTKTVEANKLSNFNVIFAGIKNGPESNDFIYPVKKVNRSKKISNVDDGIIRIGVLRNPRDLIVDVDIDKLDEDTKSKVKNYKSSNAALIRERANLSHVSQLIVYIINKDSKADPDKNDRENLNTPYDLVGVCLNIPGGKKGYNYAESLVVRITNNEDLEEEIDEV